MKTSSIVIIGILGLAATPLALHLAGGSTGTTRSWIKTLHGGLAAAQQKPAPKPAVTTLAGSWTVEIQNDQGIISATMVLKQEGKSLTGTFTNPHGEGLLPVVGEVVDGTVTLNVDSKADDHEMHLAFKGAMRDNGSLAGTMTSAMGDSKWTAVRVKDKN